MEEIYGPEDIEQLLLHKRYEELYPAEREFIAEHIETKDEYDTMRELLLSAQNADEELIVPPSDMRRELIAKHQEKHRARGFTVWLNGLFAGLAPQRKWLAPAVQLTGVVLILVGINAVINWGADSQDLAYEQTQAAESRPRAAEAQEHDEESNGPAKSRIKEENAVESQANLDLNYATQESDLKEPSAADLNEVTLEWEELDDGYMSEMSPELDEAPDEDIEVKEETIVLTDNNGLADDMPGDASMTMDRADMAEAPETIEEELLTSEVLSGNLSQSGAKSAATAEPTVSSINLDNAQMVEPRHSNIPSALISMLYTAK